jgi:Class III signal peptide
MDIRQDEKAQTSAEMILLFGGIIVIALIALIVYRNYTSGLGNNMNSDVNNVTNSINNLNAKFS